MTASIRTMIPEDIAMVADIEKRANQFLWQKKFFLNIFNKNHINLVISKANQVAGFAILLKTGQQGELLNIGIDPLFQHQGLGTALLNRLCEMAQAADLDTLFLEVRTSNSRAQQLYRKLGFNEIATRPNYYPAQKGREDAIVMAKALT